MASRVRIAIVTGAVLAGVGLPLPATAAGTATISGVAFEDANRNGVQDPGEAPRAGDTLYLFNSAGTYTGLQTTDSTGHYTFSGLATGSYRVEYKSSTWWGIRSEWAPTTTGTLQPARSVSAPTAAADFGWRRIVRSTDEAAPISSFTGPEGLRVASYDDAVPARDLYDALLRSTVGPEAGSISVLFDLYGSSTTTTVVGATAGRYDTYSASSYVTYLSWLDGGDNTLTHEYGHAWSLFHAYLTQQDPTLAGYVNARGLTSDARLGSSYAWNPREMIADDYRQLLGSPTAAAGSQMNQDIPVAAAVPGLRDYLVGAFQTAPTPSPSPTETASPSPSPTVSPTPTASTSLDASPSPTSSPNTTLSPAPTASPSPSPALTASAAATDSPTATTTSSPTAATPTVSPTASASPTATTSPSPAATKKGSCRKPC
ncbi:MAG: hypothetical protein LC789_00195 [Actinobacteria bacterium]|nr:hypothetical protein [Actinomycetota bacterium]MCA1720212.1 hypothetical protein [Actinomycetota bacterium]